MQVYGLKTVNKTTLYVRCIQDILTLHELKLLINFLFLDTILVLDFENNYFILRRIKQMITVVGVRIYRNLFNRSCRQFELSCLQSIFYFWSIDKLRQSLSGWFFFTDNLCVCYYKKVKLRIGKQKYVVGLKY